MFIVGTVILMLEPEGVADMFVTPFYIFIIYGILYMEFSTIERRKKHVELTVNRINCILDKMIRVEINRKLEIVR